MARAQRFLVAALALALALGGPATVRAQAPDRVALTRAFLTAWNAHDLDAVLAPFAPDAVVRERAGDVPAAVWETRDPQVVRAYLDGAHDGDAYDLHGFTWASGRQQIAAWAVARFAQRHRFLVAQYGAPGSASGTATGGSVGWLLLTSRCGFSGAFAALVAR